MSDTPRTDSSIFPTINKSVVYVPANIARTLERELAEAKAEIAELTLRREETVTGKEMEVSDLRAEIARLREDYSMLENQLRLSEQHALTMAQDFDASIAVVQAERDKLKTANNNLQSRLDQLKGLR